MKTDKKDFYYALINITQYLPPLLFASFVARYGDRTRNIKFSLIIINTLCLVGAVLYTIPNPLYFSVIGQFLSGFLYVQRPLMIGEIARSYPNNELKTKYSFFTGCFGVGCTLGPCVAFLFLNTDFYLFNLRITYGNIAGVIRTIQIFISIILVVVFVHDLSKEYDYKEETQDLNKIESINKIESKDQHILIKFIKEKDLLFLLFLAFFTNSVDTAFFVLYPVFIVEVLHLSTYIMNLCYILPSIVYPILSCIMNKNQQNGKVYYLAIIAWGLLILIGILEISINQIYPAWSNVVLLFTLTFVTQIFGYLCLVFILVTLSNLVQSKHQSLVDSIRCKSRCLGAVTGALVGAYGAHSKNLMGCALILISIIILVVTILRKKHLETPRIIL